MKFLGKIIWAVLIVAVLPFLLFVGSIVFYYLSGGH
jgi:hypothetical protein